MYCIIIITVTYTSYRYTSVCQAIVSSVESAIDSMVSNCDEWHIKIHISHVMDTEKLKFMVTKEMHSWGELW